MQENDQIFDSSNLFVFAILFMIAMTLSNLFKLNCAVGFVEFTRIPIAAIIFIFELLLIQKLKPCLLLPSTVQ